MSAKIGWKKTLCVFALAMVMAVSFACGSLLIKANAATVTITDLVTVSGDGKVMAGPQQYTLKNNGNDGTAAGTKVGDTGLYVQSTQDESLDGFSVELNGIFQGSTGMYVSFPGEGFWDGSYREAIMTVASISDPSEKFQLHLDDVWGMYAYVTFEYEGQTLTRSRSKYNGPDYNAETGAETLDYLYYKNTGDYFFPVMGAFQDGGSTADPRRTACYFGLEMLEDGTLNVVLATNVDWAEPYKKVIASFAEDPATFEPITSGQGETPNLPKLESFRDGYTIRFQVRDQANNKACDFLLKSVATSATGDPYKNGTTVTLDQASLAETPQFYAAWQTTPIFSLGNYAYLNDSYVGKEIVLPLPSVMRGGVREEFQGKITVIDSEGAVSVSDGRYTVRNVGTHTVRYEQGASFFEISFIAYNSGVPISEIVTAEDATISYERDIRGLTGITVRSGGNPYSGKIAGSFAGDMSISFEFPHEFTSTTGLGAKFVYTIYDAEGKAAFDIVYENTGGYYTGVSVRMGDTIRAWIEDGSYDGWSGDKGTMFYSAPTGDRCLVYPGLGTMYSEAGKSGSLQLAWEGSVFTVRVTDRNGNFFPLAKFDGSAPYSERDLDINNAIILDMTAERRYGLPKMDGSDENGADLTKGYSVGFSVTNADLPVTFLSINGIALEGRDGLATDDASLVTFFADRAAFDGENIYVAQGQNAGEVSRVYSLAFMGVAEAYEGSWAIQHEFFRDNLSKYSSTEKEVGTYSLEISLDEGGDAWKGQKTILTLHIETPYTLTFDTAGGQKIDSIVYSENTRFLLSVPDAVRTFWEFAGWYTDQELTTKWDGSLDSIHGTMTLFAGWLDVTPPSIAFAEGVAEYAELVAGDKLVISKQDVIAGDDAQGTVLLTVRYRFNDGEWTAVQGEKIELTAEEGVYTIAYTADDGAGNETVTVTRTITVLQRTAPVITVEESVTEGYAGFEIRVADATAIDMDGEKVSVVVTVTDAEGKEYEVKNGKFIPERAGVYTVSYSAKDDKGAAGYASYSVTIIADTEAPVIDVEFADQTVEKGTTVTVPVAKVTDNADSDVEVQVEVSFGTEKVALSDGKFVAEKAGTYVIRYTAEDGAGNPAEAVVVRITVLPEETVGGCSGTSFAALGTTAVLFLAAAAVSLLLRRKVK